jgi:hypothetical protein
LPERLLIFAGLKAPYRGREVSLPDEFAASPGTALAVNSLGGGQ